MRVAHLVHRLSYFFIAVSLMAVVIFELVVFLTLDIRSRFSVSMFIAVLVFCCFGLFPSSASVYS